MLAETIYNPSQISQSHNSSLNALIQAGGVLFELTESFFKGGFSQKGRWLNLYFFQTINSTSSIRKTKQNSYLFKPYQIQI